MKYTEEKLLIDYIDPDLAIPDPGRQGAARIGDYTTGHGCFPPQASVEGSCNVLVNGRPFMRIGDMFEAHCCDRSCHISTLTCGSPVVFVNGRKVGRIGDCVSCGQYVMTGSIDVFIGHVYMTPSDEEIIPEPVEFL